MVLIALEIEYSSTFMEILLFLRSPAVSMRTMSLSLNLIFVSTESLVVPGISLTIILSEPRTLFAMEDLPVLGLPAMAIRSSEFGVRSSD